MLNLNSIVTKLPGDIHYSWVIVAILALVQIISSSIGMAAGVIVTPLSEPDGGFGWSIGMIGTALMLYYFTGAVFAPISGWLGDRYGARKMMLSGGILYLFSMLLLGMTSKPWHFYITFGVMLALTQSISMVTLMAVINFWFVRRLGLGVGLLWGAGGVGTALMAPLIGHLIGTVGWQDTFWIIGIVGGTTLVMLTILFRSHPSDLNLLPYGTSSTDPPMADWSKTIERLRAKVYNAHIRRTKAFWNLPLIHALGCAGHGIILIYSIPIAVQQGISLVTASVILSLISIFSVGSRFVTPILAERFGGKPVMTTALCIQGITVIFLFSATNVWTFYMFSILFGIGFGGEMSAYMVVNRQYFGQGPIAITYGVQMMGALVGHAVATGLAGLVIYVTNSFELILGLSMAFSFVGAAVILTLEPSRRLLIPNWEETLPPNARSNPLISMPSIGE